MARPVPILMLGPRLLLAVLPLGLGAASPGPAEYGRDDMPAGLAEFVQVLQQGPYHPEGCTILTAPAAQVGTIVTVTPLDGTHALLIVTCHAGASVPWERAFVVVGTRYGKARSVFANTHQRLDYDAETRVLSACDTGPDTTGTPHAWHWTGSRFTAFRPEAGSC